MKRLLLLLLLAQPALAWNAKGHLLVARLAWGWLTPAARHSIDRILSEDTAFASPTDPRERFELASSWPDLPDIRNHGPLHDAHFIDLPLADSPGLPLPAPAEVDLLQIFPRVLGNVSVAAIGSNERAESLARVIHLVGDSHQPLHCITHVSAAQPEGDRGGNECMVVDPHREGQSIRLHTLWDAGLGGWYNDADVDYDALAGSVAALEGSLDLGGDPNELSPRVWVDESHDCAVRAYARLQFGVTAGSPGQLPPQALSPQYLEDGRQLCLRRIFLASRRLARLLNRSDSDFFLTRPVE